MFVIFQEEVEDKDLEGADQLKPYKTDLEYLDDHFQLISYKLKVKSMEKMMELDVCMENNGCCLRCLVAASALTHNSQGYLGACCNLNSITTVQKFDLIKGNQR